MEGLSLPLVVANTVREVLQSIIFDGKWYVFSRLVNNGEVPQKWISVKDEDIKQFISDSMQKVVNERLISIEEKIARLTLDDLGETTGLLAARKILLEISKRLFDVSFRTQVHSHLATNCESFGEIQKMDRSNIWVCNNTVIDFKVGPVPNYGTYFIRPGKPEDYMTMSCGINYQRNITDEAEKRLNEYLKTTFPLEENRERFLDQVSDVMSGKPRIITFLGAEASGKTTAENIIMQMFGEYGLRCHVDCKFAPILKGKKLFSIIQPLEEITLQQMGRLHTEQNAYKFSVLFQGNSLRRDAINNSVIHFENRFSSLQGFSFDELAETLLHLLIKRLCSRYLTTPHFSSLVKN